MSHELLKDRLAQVSAALKGIPGVHLHDIRHFVHGTISTNKKGQLKLPLVLPAADVLPDPRDVGPVMSGQWKMVPILMFVSSDEDTPADAGVSVHELVELTTREEYAEEARRMNNALEHFYNHFQASGVRVYSLRQHGDSVLCLSVQPGQYTTHIVGLDNRAPTPEELALLTPMLAALGIEVRYDPTSMS